MFLTAYLDKYLRIARNNYPNFSEQLIIIYESLPINICREFYEDVLIYLLKNIFHKQDLFSVIKAYDLACDRLAR